MKYRRILAIFLCLGMLLPMIPVSSAREKNTVQAADLSTSVEQQIRAFADSIDQSNADDEAARKMAAHGMTKGGKKLSADKSHPLTATLLNSELLQAALVDTCSEAIRCIQQLDTQKLENIIGACNWYGTEDSSYYTRVFDSLDSDTKVSLWTLCKDSDYSSPRNSYDETLDWITGGSTVIMTVERINVTADTTTYRVNLTVKDRFDFAISGNEFFKDLISGIGAFLFREFDWESKVTFDLKVPYSCYHESQNYRFTYDAEDKIMTNDTADGWQVNDVTRMTYSSSSGAESYYHELAETVRLRHDLPWVMEFDVRKPNSFAFSPMRESSYSHYVLFNNARQSFTAAYWEKVTVSQKIVDEYGLSTCNQTVRHSYGTALSGQFTYSAKKTYTIRLENELHADGSNMIYLTVWQTETGEMELERIPMDDYYMRQSWVNENVLQDMCDDWISGKDFLINCIGYIKYRFDPDYFELRVWENGEDGESASYYEKTSVTAPTCTEQGYSTYTCSACGHSYNADYTPAKGHSFSQWYEETAPECAKNGRERRDCSACDVFETREVAALGHNYEAVVTEPTCREGGCSTYTCSNCGDSYMDDYTDSVDHSYEDGVCIWCGAEETLVQWYSGSTSLNGTIDLNMYVILSENLVNDPETFVRFTFENREVDVPMADALVHPLKDGRVTYRFTYPLFAKQVADSVLVQVMRGETPVGEPKAYSAMQYCKNLINKNEDPEAVAMCKAMLNYAAAAQLLFNYNTENLANESLSEEDKNLPTVDVSAYKYTVINNEPGIRARGATMMMESEIRIRVYFELEEDRTIDEYTFTSDGVEAEPEQNDDGMWYIESAGIVAKGMEEMHEFKCGGITVTYGALSYVNSKLTDDDPLTVNLAKALYAYYIAAENLLG